MHLLSEDNKRVQVGWLKGKISRQNLMFTTCVLNVSIWDTCRQNTSCVKASTTRKGAKKVTIESHDFIMAETSRREALEDINSANNTDDSGVSCSSSSSSAGENSSSDSE